MTPEEMRGKEIDQKVAETVMGWVRTHDRDYPQNIWWHTPDGDEFELPEYSSEIKDAWDVVEKMTESSPRWLFNLERLQGDPDLYYEVDFWDNVGEIYHHRAHADTATLAICFAALKAVEGK